MQKNGKPSSIDVARLACVSQSAVSRSFTPGASVSAKTRAKVMTAAAALSYKPNLIPRIMATGRSAIVAVVAGGFYNPFFASTLETFVRALRNAGKQVMLVHAESDRTLDDVVSELARYRVDAVVTALSIGSQAVADTLAMFNIPIVTLNAGITGGLIRAVISDNEGGSAAAAALLVRRGGRCFGYVGGPDSPQQAQRERGFAEGLAALGHHSYVRAIGDFDYGGGYRAVCEMFARSRPPSSVPDSLFCMNDLAACGVIDALRHEFGLRVPEDVMVVGYDDIAMAGWAAYDLTTFNQDIGALVAGVMRMLGETPPAETILRVPPTLVERGSTRPPLCPAELCPAEAGLSIKAATPAAADHDGGSAGGPESSDARKAATH